MTAPVDAFPVAPVVPAGFNAAPAVPVPLSVLGESQSPPGQEAARVPLRLPLAISPDSVRPPANISPHAQQTSITRPTGHIPSTQGLSVSLFGKLLITVL